MSTGLTVTETGERIEINQVGRELLAVTEQPPASLTIVQEQGDRLVLDASVQNLIFKQTGTQTLIIHEPAGDTLVIAAPDTGPGAPVYGRPYTRADDGALYYFAWQHMDGTRWKAQRYELATMALVAITGDNPQPETLNDFQNLSF